MAITTWTYEGTTAFVNMTSPTNITANGNSFILTLPSLSLAANGPYMESTFKYLYTLRWIRLLNGSTEILKNLQAATSAYVKKNTYAAAAWATPTATLNTADFFNSNNPNDRTVALSVASQSSYSLLADDDHQGGMVVSGSSQLTFATINLTLDVPPTATVSAITYDKPFIYAGLTTASVTISNAAAYYGGTITDVTFRIGAQTASAAGDGTLSIALDTAGTFTPTVTVTDSRGQTKTYTLPAITVLTYSAPTVSFTAERTTAAGVPDDEGTYATCPATFVFADAIATAVAPSVVLTDENGTQTTPTVSWYTTRAADGTLSGSVTWSSLASGDTVYASIPGLNTNYSYQISIRPRDSQGTGTAITQTVSSAFYTVDFLAGGHGIAVGKPAANVGFECAMDATFDNPVVCDDTLTANDLLICNNDVYIDLSDYQTPGTTDEAIYNSIVALGWDNDVFN